MFGISFGELMIIGVVGLIVFGPEKLPAVARTVGRLMRQVQDYTHAFKTELNRELHNAEILQLEKELKEEGRKLQAGLTDEFSEVQKQLEEATPAALSPLEPDRWHEGTRPEVKPSTIAQDDIPVVAPSDPLSGAGNKT